MPIFEYTCPNCGHCFEKLILSSKRRRELSCPECGSKRVKRAMSTFSYSSGGAFHHATGDGCGGCSKTSCGGCSCGGH